MAYHRSLRHHGLWRGNNRKKVMKESTALKQIQPVKPVAPYIGGKSRLAKEIIGLINAVEHTTYAEAFVGMGGVFLRRSYQPKSEVINDYNFEVANLFRVLQRHYVAFLDMIKWQITTRAEFNRLCETDPATLTDLERAARFLYLQKLAFGGKVSGKNFGVDPVRGGRFDVTKLQPMLEDLHERLSGVTIECLDYKAFIKRYDRAGTLFYLDPPYYGCEGDYGKELFSRDEFKLMAELLSDIKGKFILSLNDHLMVREIFDGFHFKEVQTTYTISGVNNNKRMGELLITNFKEGN